MLVVDDKRSEHHRQRRRDALGHVLHCCCICGKLGRWRATWSWYGSYKEEDDCEPLAKFCSKRCAKKAGDEAQNVTDEMKRAAKEAEWREPKIVYREATDAEKYTAAVSKQSRRTRQPHGYDGGDDAA